MDIEYSFIRDNQETPTTSNIQKDLITSPEKKKTFCVQKWRDSWMIEPQFAGWLSKSANSTGNKDYAFCKICNKDITCGKSEITRHSQSQRHKKIGTEKSVVITSLVTATVPLDVSVTKIESQKVPIMDDIFKSSILEQVLQEETPELNAEREVFDIVSPKQRKRRDPRMKKEGNTPKRRKIDYIRVKDEFKNTSYKQMFRKEWMDLPEFKEWLMEGMFPYQGYCYLCQVNLPAGKTELLSHGKSQRHQMKLQEYHDKGVADDLITAVVDEFGDTHLFHFIDLRSDSLSEPSKEMRKAMVESNFGDTSFGTDKPVKELENFVANMLDKEDGLLFPTHIMANLAAGLAHCQSRGSAVIAGTDSDITHNNKEAFVKFGGLHFRTIEENEDGSFSLDNLKNELEALDLNPPLSALVTFECAHARKGGRITPMDWIDELGHVCLVYKCFLHCDGTRLINASLSKSIPLPNFVKFCDSVTLAIDKSLGAPVGAVLVGEKAFIEKARYIREFLGGNIHQAGMFAAAGLFGLNHLLPNVDWDIDKAKAIALAVEKEDSSIIYVEYENVETNIIHLRCNTEILNANQLKDRLASVNEEEPQSCGNESVIVLSNAPHFDTVSLMVHNKISHSEVKLIIQKLIYIIKEYTLKNERDN